MFVTIVGAIAITGLQSYFSRIYAIGISDNIIKHTPSWNILILPVACIAVVTEPVSVYTSDTIIATIKNPLVYVGTLTSHNSKILSVFKIKGIANRDSK